MTTQLQLQLQEPLPDKLIATIEIKLTSDQKAYIQENITMYRTPLLKLFNLKFGVRYTKLQFTRAVEIMNEPKVIPKRKDSPNNVYYKKRDKCWEARVTVKKKRILLYTGSKAMAIKAVAEYRSKK